jgi:hypothetical protein
MAYCCLALMGKVQSFQLRDTGEQLKKCSESYSRRRGGGYMDIETSNFGKCTSISSTRVLVPVVLWMCLEKDLNLSKTCSLSVLRVRSYLSLWSVKG